MTEFKPLLALLLMLSLSVGLNAQSLVFTEDEYTTSLNETFLPEYPLPPNGFLVIACNATNVSYSILSPLTSLGPFVLNDTSGEFSVINELDFETTTAYQFEVTCTSIDNPSLNDTAVVNIQILPVNEFRPTVDDNAHTVTINEQTAIGTMLVSIIPGAGTITYTATDNDAGPDNEIFYTLGDVTGNENITGKFVFNSTIGAIIVSGELDLDVLMVDGGVLRVAFRITVCDIDPPLPNCPTIEVNVIVFSTNDNLPMFSADLYNVAFPETLPSGTDIITASCTDDDFGIGTFRGIAISQVLPSTVPPNTFSIDSNTGAITLTGSLDFEISSTYEIQLSCTDTGNQEDTAQVVIQIEDENDNEPIIVTDTDTLEAIHDRTPTGTVVSSFQCSDADSGENANITYSISSDNGTTLPFVVDPLTGNVSVSQSLLLPAEVFSTNYTITLQCEDNGAVPRMNSASLVLQVYKDDFTPPQINDSSISGGSLSVREDANIGDVIATLTATDTTSPSLVFSFESESSLGQFEIDSQTGVISVARSLDREEQDTYSLRVVATEVRIAPGTPQNDSRDVVISITDVNDNSPVVAMLVVILESIHDRTPIGTIVSSIQCSDADSGENANITYSMSSDNGTTLPFVVDPLTGNVSVSQSLLLPAEVFSTNYTITLQCEDNGAVPLMNSTSLVLQVYKDDFTPPQINDSSISGGALSVREDASIGDVITTLTATDTTSPSLVFSFESESSPGQFEIDSQTGVISVARSPDREEQDTYSLRVVATEVRIAPGTPQNDSRDVVISITDVNDNSPQCTRTSYSGTINVGSYEMPSTILSLTCSDRDDGENGRLTYVPTTSLPSVSGGSFTLNQASGQVSFQGTLSTQNATYTFEVRVSDAGIPTFSTTVNVSIRVAGETEDSGLPVPLYVIIVPIVGGLLLICCVLILCCCCCYTCNRRRVNKKKKNLFDSVVVKDGEPKALIISQYPKEGPQAQAFRGDMEYHLSFETTSFSGSKLSDSSPTTPTSTSPEGYVITTTQNIDIVVTEDPGIEPQEPVNVSDSHRDDLNVEGTQESIDMVMSKV